MKLLKKEMLTRTTTKPGLGVFALISAVVISVGYVLFLAILAPEQLAEATAAASDLVCSGCVGNSDIANDAVGSAKIGSGQVGTSDIASSAVTSAKIGSGQVANSDIATNAVTTGKISDTNGVQSVDIVNGQVGSVDIGNGQVAAVDIVDNAIMPNVQLVTKQYTVPENSGFSGTASCPAGMLVTGGGFFMPGRIMAMEANQPLNSNTWEVRVFNTAEGEAGLVVNAVCIGPIP
jgi:hypothetical protein